MAKKSALKKKKALDRKLRKRAGQPPLINDLGDYLQEFLLRGLYLFSLKHGQDAIQTTTAQTHALLQEKAYSRIAALLGLDKIPREKAQILAYQALACKDQELATKYTVQSLRLDPTNIDALMWQARSLFETDKTHPDKPLATMREITAFAEHQMGPQLQTFSGKIHEFHLARPYLRALHTLFECVDTCNLTDEALAVGQKLLDLCGPDLFHIRERVMQLNTHIQDTVIPHALDHPAQGEQEVLPLSSEEAAPAKELSEEQQTLFDEISSKTDAFCKTYLNETFKERARHAIALLLCNDAKGSTRRGKRESWASGIMHALAQANKLFEPDHALSTQPVTMHTFFKVSSSTTSKKSALIRKQLNITQDNPDWICRA